MQNIWPTSLVLYSIVDVFYMIWYQIYVNIGTIGGRSSYHRLNNIEIPRTIVLQRADNLQSSQSGEGLVMFCDPGAKPMRKFWQIL